MTHEAGQAVRCVHRFNQEQVHNTAQARRAMWYLKHTNTSTHNMMKRHFRQHYTPPPECVELNMNVYIKGADRLSADIDV